MCSTMEIHIAWLSKAGLKDRSGHLKLHLVEGKKSIRGISEALISLALDKRC